MENIYTQFKMPLNVAMLSCCTAMSSTVAAESSTSSKPNVLMIAVDDRNDWIGCMGGQPQAITPNIDRLAEEGLLFLNNHCQAPIPSTKRGGRCEAPTQLLDIYPTLLELCGLPANQQVDGNSLAPLLKNSAAEWNKIAVTSYGVGNFSLRDHSHRYIVYEDGSEELYDMVNDPNEWTNLASNPKFAEVIARFKKALPKKQAPLSKVAYYTINEYWRAKIRDNK